MDRGDIAGKTLQERVEEMEHRIVLFEELFHAFSSRLDKHFEKYDRLIGAQQRQIGELSSALALLAGDHVQSAKLTREKVLGAMGSVPPRTTPASSAPSTLHDSPMAPVAPDGVATAVDDFSELVSSRPGNRTAPKPGDDFAVPAGSDSKRSHSKTGPDAGMDVYKPAPGTFHHQPQSQLQPQVPQQQIPQQIPQPAAIPPPVQMPPAQLPPAQIPQAQTHSSPREKRRKVADSRPYDASQPYRFQNNPQTVREVWAEFTEGVDGQPSIKQMETMYQTSWRRDPATNKRFCRRKALWKAIEVGLVRGYTLDFIIDLLEDTRYIDARRQSKHPIGWLSQTANIPELLR